MTMPMYNPRPKLQPRSRRPNPATGSAPFPPTGPTATTTAPNPNRPTTMPPTAIAPPNKRTAAEAHDSDREDSTPKRVRVSAWVDGIPDNAGLGGGDNQNNGTNVTVNGLDGAGLPPPPSAEESWKRRSFFKDGVRRVESVEKGKGKTGDDDWMMGDGDSFDADGEFFSCADLGRGGNVDEDEEDEDEDEEVEEVDYWLMKRPDWSHLTRPGQGSYADKRARMRRERDELQEKMLEMQMRHPERHDEFEHAVNDVEVHFAMASRKILEKERAKELEKHATVEDAADEDANNTMAPRINPTAPAGPSTAAATSNPPTANNTATGSNINAAAATFPTIDPSNPPSRTELIAAVLQTVNATLIRLAAAIPTASHLSHLAAVPGLTTALQEYAAAQQQHNQQQRPQPTPQQQTSNHPIALAAKQVAAMKKLSFRRKMDALVQFERDENKARVYLALGEAGERALQKAYLNDLVQRERDERPWAEGSEEEF
ncbi:hypothetical protein K490DRAFT_67337 [Saccharata proteae CBS 121410]|uniref:Uncharacterized protein n=1 Tax=Saccharata proteae CBS 121410 TaxID=1314787 RepID=A0A9P4LY88_9PEZI|nr:hypothetical protein K490DRAFT_67337 [Saccharata proteae CBS 121410]